MVPSLLMILDKCTGGNMKTASVEDDIHGTWGTNALFPLYCISGVCYGMIELLKRVIPRDIVGGDVDKLRQIDSLVSPPSYSGLHAQNVDWPIRFTSFMNQRVQVQHSSLPTSFSGLEVTTE
jgi:hypothetical protein